MKEKVVSLRLIVSLSICHSELSFLMCLHEMEWGGGGCHDICHGCR